jgi:hypothetical protein
MRSRMLLVRTLLLAALPLAGCASNGHGLVLDPVGPPVFQPSAGSNGTLVVFSAYDPNAHFNSLPYRRVHSDYSLVAADGTRLQTIHNDNGTSVEGPKAVLLPAGEYRVVALANGYGTVTVPVVVEVNQTTTVHLEGGNPWGSKAPSAKAKPVRLPDGEIVGWRADTQRTDHAAPEALARYHHEVISEFNDGESKFLQLVPDNNPQSDWRPTSIRGALHRGTQGLQRHLWRPARRDQRFFL